MLFGLQQGSEVLKQLNKELDIDKVEKLMDETREGIAYQEVRQFLHFITTWSLMSWIVFVEQEVSALLSSRISAADEEDVLAELAALQEAEVRFSRLSMFPFSSLRPLSPSSIDRSDTCTATDPVHLSSVGTGWKQATSSASRQITDACRHIAARRRRGGRGTYEGASASTTGYCSLIVFIDCEEVVPRLCESYFQYFLFPDPCCCRLVLQCITTLLVTILLAK